MKALTINRIPCLLVTALASLCLMFSPLWAQEETADTTTTIDDLYIDFAIPDLGAFTLLGITPATVSRPGNVKEFAADVLGVASTGGQITPGIAIEWAPYQTVASLRKGPMDKNQLETYRNSHLLRGLQLSYGTVQDTAGAKMALGLKWTVLDESDPLLDTNLINKIDQFHKRVQGTSPLRPRMKTDFTNKVRTWFSEVDTKLGLNDGDTKTELDGFFQFPASGKDSDEAPPILPLPYQVLKRDMEKKMATLSGDRFKAEPELNADLSDLITEYLALLHAELEFRNQQLPTMINKLEKDLDDYRKKNWNHFAIALGAGHIWESEDYSWRGLEGNKLSAYGQAAIPLLHSKKKTDRMIQLQLLLNAQFSQFYRADSGGVGQELSGGGRLLLGHNDFRISTEARYTQNFIQDGDATNNLRMTGGVEMRLSDGIWLELVLGTDSSLGELKDQQFLSLAGFKYALVKKRRFGL